MTTAQVEVKQIRTKEDLNHLQRGDIFTLNIDGGVSDTFIRVLKLGYDASVPGMNVAYIDVCYRAGQHSIVDAHIMVKNCKPKGDGTLNSDPVSYSLGHRGRAADFDKLEAFLKEVGL